MNETASLVCRAFLLKCNAEKRDALLTYLPFEELQQMEKLSYTYKDPTQPTQGIESRLKEIHPSWFAPFLRSYPSTDIRLFLSALEEGQREDLKKIILFSSQTTRIKSPAKRFFQEVLFYQIVRDEQDLLPIEYLPESPLNALLSLSYSELVALINLLGLHDLAFEMQYIIESAKLKQIQQSLDQDEQAYLKKLLQQKDAITFARLNLTKWDGKSDTLKALLHKRGLNRLAKAIFHQHSSLKWHLVHKLDMERAASLNKLCTELENPRANVLLAEQVLRALSIIESRKTP